MTVASPTRKSDSSCGPTALPIITTKSVLLAKYPEYRVNVWDFVEFGYRLPTQSYRACVRSLFMIHNELVNVWSHVLGVLVAVLLAVQAIMCTTDIGTACILAVYLLAGLSTFGISALYHLLSCHSIEVCRRYQHCDWMTISTLIFGSNLLCAYFELYAEHWPAFAAFSAINAVLMVAASNITSQSLKQMYRSCGHGDDCAATNSEPALGARCGGSGWQLLDDVMHSYAFRTWVYMVYASGCMIAWTIHCCLDGFDDAGPTLWGLLTMYGCYLAVIFCLFDFPEKMFPGRFDIVGQSHQILHAGTVCGFVALWRTYIPGDSCVV